MKILLGVVFVASASYEWSHQNFTIIIINKLSNKKNMNITYIKVYFNYI